MKQAFTQTTNDLSHLLRAFNKSKRDKKIVALPRVKTRKNKSNIVATRTAIVKAIQKEIGVDESTARGIMKIRGLK